MGNITAVDICPTPLSQLIAVDPKSAGSLTLPECPEPSYQHIIKIWKLGLNHGEIQSQAVAIQLDDMPTFQCFSSETYVVLIVSKQPEQLIDAALNHIPWKFRVIVKSMQLVSKQSAGQAVYESANSHSQYLARVFHLEGISAPPKVSIKSLGMALELENKLKAGGPGFLRFLFHGGTYRNSKVQIKAPSKVVSESEQELAVQSAGEDVQKYSILRTFYKAPKSNHISFRLKNKEQLQHKSRFQVQEALGSLEKSLFKVEMSEIKPRDDHLNFSNFQNDLDMSLAKNNHSVIAPHKNTPFANITQMQEDQIDEHQDRMMAYGKPLATQDSPSKIATGVFLSGQTIAYDYEVIKQLKITTIINCAADYCVNRFQGLLDYYEYFIKDSQKQNIECLFHEICAIIDSVVARSESVLIHCVQGMSRSVAVGIAYLMTRNKLTYDAAEKAVLAVRPQAAPNQGFMAQLLGFQKRISEPVGKYRVYAVCSYQKQTPSKLVAKEFGELYKDKTNVLDSRGVFIVLTPSSTILWLGGRCIDPNAYAQFANSYIKLLVRYQRASEKLVIYKQGSEPSNFWQMFGLKSPPTERFNNLVNFYIPLKGRYVPPGLKNQQALVFKLPNPIPLTHMKLNEKYMYVLITQTADNGCIMLWKGIDWDGDDSVQKKFVHGLVQAYLQGWDGQHVLMYTRDDDDYPEAIARIVDYV